MKQRYSKFFPLLFAGLLCLPAVQAAEINATLQWSDVRNLGTTVTARVNSVNVRPGMSVQQGDLLVDIDKRYFENQKNRAASLTRSFRLALDEAKLEQERAIELYDRTVLSQFDRRKADIQLAAAQADYSGALSALNDAKLDLEYSQILAPYDAVVLAVAVAPGEVFVNSFEARTLVKVARAGEMLAVASVAADQLTGIKPGQQLDAAFRGEWHSATVHSIEPEHSGSYLLAVRFTVSADKLPRAGEVSAIRLP